MTPLWLTRLEQQLTRAENRHDHPERQAPERPAGDYVLRFYDRRRQLLTEHTTVDCHFLARNYEQHLLGTPLEYMIRLNHTAFYKRNEYGQLRKHDACSYVDILCNGRFVCRHFYRGGQLYSLVSYEPNINNDAYARLGQITTVPVINWTDFFNEAAWGRVDRNISIEKFIKKYARTNNK